MSHPVLQATRTIGEALKDVADVNPTFMGGADQAAALTELAALEAKVVELRLRILAAADDLATTSGARDAAAWWAQHTRGRHDEARSDLRLAQALDHRYAVLATGMRDGQVNRAQAQVITRALDHLPDNVGADVVAHAEETLVAHAADFGPRGLARLGRHVLDVVAPEVAEEAEGRRLAALEAAAEEATRLTLRPVGDGTTRLTARLPDATATRLATYLEAFTNPRSAHACREESDGEKPVPLPHPRRLGQAFCQLLEAFDPDRLPLHGGDATTVVVTIPLAALRRDLATADLLNATEDSTISAGQARRLACTAGIVPAVLGGRSEVLDLGRRKRLFSRKQRLAMLLRDRTCRAEGCDIPGTWAEAHHWQPWSTGGRTDLADGVLLCSHHHHRIHEPIWRGERLPSGDVRFHRRT